MNWYEEDFYNEPSEFDIVVDNFKAELMKSVKDEFINKMNQLKKENEELQDVKKNFNAIKREYKNKERQLENERSNLKRAVRKERLSEITKDKQVIMYRAMPENVKLPKCDKCDENRRIYYKTPLGKDRYEKCNCDTGKIVYKPTEHIRVEFNIRNGMRAWYKINNFGTNDEFALFDEISQYADSVYKEGMNYSKVNRHSTFFKTKEECQKYCDWLNSNKNNQ